MKNQEKSNLIYTHYSSINLNNYFPLNQKDIFPSGPSHNCNFNKINPTNSARTQQIHNNRNLSTPNYINSKKTNSTINLNKLNIIGNNNTKNISTSKYTSSSIVPLDNPLNSYYNYFSPPSQRINKNLNYANLSSIKTQLQKNNKITKYISSPLLNYDKPIISKKNNKKTRKKTLILDLDETLVHSGFNKFNRKSDIVLNINIDGRNHTIYVLKRPYVDEFLREISKFFEIFIFTASISQYASPLLDELDKENICDRRFFREHCVYNSGLYLKDLKQIGKDLKDVIIIDNNPVSYVLNQDNGIPILTWYDNLNDNELNKLIPLLRYLSKVDDVRPVIKQIVDREKNALNFDVVDSLIKNEANTINGGNNHINSKMTNNYENMEYDENMDININMNNNNEEKFGKYLENGKSNNLYEFNKYNRSIDSLSNMTYDEIQNEGHIDNKNNDNSDYNLEKPNNYKERNNSILSRTKELFNGIKNNNYINYLDKNEYYKTDKRSFTPNLNRQRKNNYYNKEKGKENEKNNLILTNQKNKNINNIIDKIQDNIKKVNEIRDNMIFDFRKSKDIFFKGSRDIIKGNNNLVKDDKYANNLYLQSSKKTTIRKNEKIDKNQKLFNIRNNKNNNIKNSEENKNKNCFSNSNANYTNYHSNNIINKKNTNDNNIKIGFNYNTINSKKAYKNKIENNHNNINLNQLINGKNNEIINKKNNEIIHNSNDNGLKNNKNKSIIDLRREKLNEIKRKMEEINKDIKETEDKLYFTQNNFMPKKEINKNNNLYFPNPNNGNQEENEESINNFQTKDKISNLNDNNIFNRSFSGNKDFIFNNKEMNSTSSYYINRMGENQNNIKIITNADDIDYINNKNINYRADTEVATNNNNYNIDTIMNNAEKNKSTRSLVVNKKIDNYNDINMNIRANCFNHTYNNGFTNFQNNNNINNRNNKDEIGKNVYTLNKKYNNININNWNNLMGENEDKNNNQINVVNNNEYNGKLLMNKSSSNFYQKMTIDLNEEEKNINDINVKDINFEKNYNYKYNKNYADNYEERKIVKKNSFNGFEMNNSLFRKKTFNNFYNFNFN